jgi:hypothetical protein
MRKVIIPIRTGKERKASGMYRPGLTFLRRASAKEPLGQSQLHHVRPRERATPIPSSMHKGIK